MRNITMKGIATRYLLAFAMVCISWNPSPYNYYRWAMNQWSDLTPIVVLFGLVILVTWIVFVRATMRSLGPVGIGLAVAIAGTILWTIIYYDLIDPTNSTTLGWVLLTLLAAVLTAGMSWSHLRRRWSGQADIDDVDEVG